MFLRLVNFIVCVMINKPELENCHMVDEILRPLFDFTHINSIAIFNLASKFRKNIDTSGNFVFASN